MEIRLPILWIIIGASIVTLVPRVLPLAFLSRFQLPEWGMRWLNHVPVAVMAALLAQELLLSNNEVSIFANSHKLLAALPAFIVAIKTRSLFGTVMAGILTMMTLQYLN